MTTSPLTSARVLVPFALLLTACSSTSPTDPGGAVATVEIVGASRAKVGDPNQFTATAKLADGTVVQRQVTWSVVEPNRGTVSSAGVLTTTASGPLTLRATVEGITDNATLESYDWRIADDGAVRTLTLASNNVLLNTDGQPATPDLMVGCAAGTLFLIVFTPTFHLEDGDVSYNFNHGQVINSTWIVSIEGGALKYPGPTNLVHKQFLATLAASTNFGFRFTEVTGGDKVATYRTVGLAEQLPELLAGCPSDA